MRLLIVRHAQTHSNVARRFQGSGRGVGSVLTQEGRRQALTLANHLEKRFKVDKIYSSPSKRTLETAEILNDALQSSIHIQNDLREIDCGDWEDKTSELIERTNPEQWAVWQSEPLAFRFPNGESLLDVRARTVPFLENLIGETGQTIALVSHSATISVMLASLHNWSLREAWADGRGYHPNAAFSVLEFKTGKLTFSEIACTPHLK